MTDRPFDDPQPEVWVAAPRRAAHTVDLLIAANLEDGRHIHLLDPDGDWCLDGRCMGSTDVQGVPAPGDDNSGE